MVTGTTSTGFEYTIDERIRNDRRISHLLVVMIKKDGDPLDIMSANDELPVVLLGEEQAEKLFKHVESLNDGIQDNSKINDEILEIFKGSNDLKN